MHKKRLLLLLILLACTAPLSAVAEVPHVMNYQGRLTDSTGLSMDTTVNIQFWVYGDTLGTTLLWTESHTDVSVTAGLFSVLLGTTTPLPDSIFDGSLLGLGVRIGTGQTQKLIPLTTTAYAYRSAKADTAGYAMATPGGSSVWTISGDDIYYDNGNVGIGTDSPGYELDVAGVVNAESAFYFNSDEILHGRGNGNVGVGLDAGQSNTGTNNTFVGNYAAPNNEGSHNVIIGRSTGYYHTTGDNNTFVGNTAGYNNTSGRNNVFVGMDAGRESNASNSVFLGRGAGYGVDDSSTLVIDNSSAGTPLIYGDFMQNQVGINQNDPESNLEVGGGVTSSGDEAGYKFYDRGGNPSNSWTWFADNSKAFLHWNGPIARDAITATTDGNVGINQPSPGDHRLFVKSRGHRVHGSTGFFQNTSDSGIAIMAENSSDDATAVFLQKGSGDALRCFYIDGEGVWNFLFRVTNTGRAICNELELLGGADLAEPFAISGETVPAGALVVIDDENPGRLKLSRSAYDTRVAGIVSGAGGVKPGLTLSQKDVFEDGQNVAINGRVYCRADASYGAIRPGDLLTTSDTPGHAMRAADRDRAYGSVVGKAMSSLDDGRGLVLVLVNLQ